MMTQTYYDDFDLWESKLIFGWRQCWFCDSWWSKDPCDVDLLRDVFCVFFLRFLFSKGTVPLARRAEGDRMGSLLAFTSVIAVDWMVIILRNPIFWLVEAIEVEGTMGQKCLLAWTSSFLHSKFTQDTFTFPGSFFQSCMWHQIVNFSILIFIRPQKYVLSSLEATPDDCWGSRRENDTGNVFSIACEDHVLGVGVR
jgi:hypothetical protein